jgi:hypothetical protein
VIIPTLPEGVGLTDAALAFTSGGIYIGPLRSSTKHPGSILGKGWPAKTVNDPMGAMDVVAGRPEGTGLFIHCGRSGLVVLDVDYPDEIPEEWWEFLDRAPFQSTRTDVPRKGHYFFKVPDGRSFGNGNGRAGKAWGEVRGRNGVVVTQPTAHAKAKDGGRYLLVRGGEPFDLPPLIADLLNDSSDTVESASVDELEDFFAKHTASRDQQLLSPRVQRLYGVLEGDRKADGTIPSRHNETLMVAADLAKESAAGFYPARAAFDELRDVFEFFMRNGNGKEFRPGWSEEYEGMWCWAIAQATPEAVAAVKARRDRDNAGFAARRAASAVVVSEPSPEPPAAPAAQLMYPNIPTWFWDLRPELGKIRDAAHAETCGADVVFHSVLARLASMIPHTLRMFTGVGNESGTNLNYFVAVMGQPGMGKTSGISAAGNLMPDWVDPRHEYRYNLPLGSGQGIPARLMGPVGTGKEMRLEQVRNNMHFICDEGEIIAKAAKNPSDILGATLRSAWIGASLGQSNASEDRNRFIPAKSYSMGLVVAFQPGSATSLFDEANGGTPQRFIFASAADPSISRERGQGSGRLDGLMHVIDPSSSFNRVMHFPKHIQDANYAYRADVLACRVAVRELDEHALLHRCKLATLLALLARTEVTDEDWELAGMLWDTSCAVRDVVLAQQQAEAAKRWQLERERTAETAVYSAQKVAKAHDDAEQQKVGAVLESIVATLRKTGGELRAIGAGGVKQRLRSNRRALFDDAVAMGIDNDVFTFNDGVLRLTRRMA